MARTYSKTDDVMWAAHILDITERLLFEKAYRSMRYQRVSNNKLEVFFLFLLRPAVCIDLDDTVGSSGPDLLVHRLRPTDRAFLLGSHLHFENGT